MIHEKSNIIPWLVFTAILLGSACTKNFEKLNTNPNNETEEELSVGYRLMGEPLLQAQLNLLIYNDPPTAQLQQNLNADIFGGYTMTPTPFEGNNNNSNYGLIFYWNNHPWNVTYSNVMKSSVFAQEKARNKYPDFYAWAQILKVEGMHRLADIYGPIIYSHYGRPNPDQSVDYDTQQEVYYQFFQDLDHAIRILTDYVNSQAEQRFKSFDLVYKGNYTRWIRFANSLRLRLAIRISGVDKQKAQLEGKPP
ncbi:SusD/RagB family nutrient-binding outer membrane lipoprotein [Paraflavitalea speifideaquila]|uniref:SusD/RagB family nutrient-binding outer membrane lipoprotein n=1 Tax=Paraflavitalea speifideaquila TaxID=3076558 RepID=UPI0028E42DD2|nr:SusD/RagB family nutrient-binding outer membrane lipoprotein [Paraflavitalea speifideiaquila]